MSRKRTYTDADKERARVLWETNGNATRATARDAQIPLATIQAWIEEWKQPPPLAPREVYEAVYETIRTDKKAEIIEAAWDVAKAAMERAKEALPDASAKDAATVAGIVIDKAQLLSGDATERTEHNVKAILGILPADLRAEVIRLAADSSDA
jgi:hypothetical protein